MYHGRGRAARLLGEQGGAVWEAPIAANVASTIPTTSLLFIPRPPFSDLELRDECITGAEGRRGYWASRGVREIAGRPQTSEVPSSAGSREMGLCSTLIEVTGVR